MPAAPVSLFSVTAAILLVASDGSRILAKYYSTPHSHLHTTAGGSNAALVPTESNPYPTPTLQKAFEKGLHQKTQKPASQPGAGDIILYDNRVVVFKQEGDVMLYIVGGAAENEMLLWHVLLGWRDALNILLKCVNALTTPKPKEKGY